MSRSQGKVWLSDTASQGLVALVPHKRRHLKLTPVCLMKSMKNQVQATARCRLHPARCTLHTARYILHAARCTLHAARCTLHAARCTPHTAHRTLHPARCTLHAARCTLRWSWLVLTPAMTGTPRLSASISAGWRNTWTRRCSSFEEGKMFCGMDTIWPSLKG